MCYYIPSQNMYLCTKTFDVVTAEEMEKMDKLEEVWKKATKQLSAYELLEIFPEARCALTRHLKHDIQENKKLVDELYRKERELTNKVYERVAAENRWYSEALIHQVLTTQRTTIEKLIRKQSFFLNSLTHPAPDVKKNNVTDQDIARAKEYPIESLYPGGLVGHNGKKFGLCPLHEEKTPSFTIYTNTNTFYCFGCSVAGDSISYVMKTQRLEFVEAVRSLLSR